MWHTGSPGFTMGRVAIPSAIPSTLVIDREGRVAARVLGPTTYSELKRLVDEVAAEPA